MLIMYSEKLQLLLSLEFKLPGNFSDESLPDRQARGRRRRRRIAYVHRSTPGKLKIEIIHQLTFPGACLRPYACATGNQVLFHNLGNQPLQCPSKSTLGYRSIHLTCARAAVSGGDLPESRPAERGRTVTKGYAVRRVALPLE